MKPFDRKFIPVILLALALQSAGMARPGASILLLVDEPDTMRSISPDTSLQADSTKISNRSGIHENNRPGQFRHANIDIKIGKAPKLRKVWPTGALLRSALVPGWGQVYNRQYIKAGIYGGVEIFLLYRARQNWRQMDFHQSNFMNTDDPAYKAEQFNLYIQRRDDRNIYLWFTGLTIFISMFDAYVDAHLANFDQTDKAFEVYIAPDDGQVNVGLACRF